VDRWTEMRVSEQEKNEQFFFSSAHITEIKFHSSFFFWLKKKE
jgi:hypothetical protein